MKTSNLGGPLAACALAATLTLFGCAPAQPNKVAWVPRGDASYTSTREIRSLAATPGGGLWAATTGGILHFDGVRWVKFSRRDGLPTNEWGHVQVVNGLPCAEALDGRTLRFAQGHWAAAGRTVYRPLDWRGSPVAVSAEGLLWGKRHINPPPGRGALLTAALPLGSARLLCALFGDGLWNFDGRGWSRAYAGLPAGAREITALAGDADCLWLGTRRAGIFRRTRGKWTQFLQPDEPYAHNIEFLCTYRGDIWASTLEDGLVARTAEGWQHCGEPALSSGAPRQMAVYRDELYVRHGGGAVDKWDGTAWSKNVLARLVRRSIYSLAADDHRLYAAVWGGWSECEGGVWSNHFDVPELQGIPVMGLLPDGDRLWIATQSRGLGLWNRATREFNWFDERNGLPDDWVTCLAKVHGRVFAGTFVGGLAAFDGKRWRAWEQLKGQNVTAIQPGEGGTVWVGTRTGLWQLAVDGMLKPASQAWQSTEIQALARVPGGLWVGSRTGLDFVAARSPKLSS